jgi:hypothetical protein
MELPVLRDKFRLRRSSIFLYRLRKWEDPLSVSSIHPTCKYLYIREENVLQNVENPNL